MKLFYFSHSSILKKKKKTLKNEIEIEVEFFIYV